MEGSADLFFRSARIAHDGGTPLRIDAVTVLQIAADEAETIRFRQLARTINNDELRDLMLIYLGNLQKSQGRQARSADLWGENIRLGVGGVGSATVLTGIVSIIATGGTAGALVLVACGIGGIASAVGGNSFFRWRANRDRDAAEDIATLVDALRK